jgi:hypothetical protein
MNRYWTHVLGAAVLALGAQNALAQPVNGCPAGQALQSSDPSGRNIVCVRIPDTAALQQQINNEISARQGADNALGASINAEVANRQAADNALGARIDGLTETDIVGHWAVAGTTSCLQSSTNFSTNFMSPIIPIGGTAAISQLIGTFLGKRTFNAGGTGHSVGSSHTMSTPATLYGAPGSATSSSNNFGGASVATLDGDFTWSIQPDGALLINDANPLRQPFTAPPARVGFTATIENRPPLVGYISKDRRTIVMTHPGMTVETSTTRDQNEVVQGSPTPRFCARYRVLTRLPD